MYSPKTKLLIPLVVLFATFASARSADADKKEKAKNRISAVSFDDAGQQTTIAIDGSSTPTFTVYKLERPTRVVVDISGATLSDKVKDAQENGATLPVSTWAVNQVAAYELDDGGKLVRVVVTLARPGRYDVQAKGERVVVTVVARDDAPEVPDAADVEAAQKTAEKAKKDSEAANAARAKAEKDAAKAKTQADASKQEADAAKQALADAKTAAAKAEKKSKAERDKADQALAEAKAEAERTKKVAAETKAEADRTKKAVADAEQKVAKTMKVAERARAELEAIKEELAAAKADAKQQKDAAVAAKQEADAAKADATAQRKKAGDAEKDAAKAAAKAEVDIARAEEEAAEAADEAARSEKAAKQAKADAAQAKKDAEKATKDATEAKKASADDKKAAAAAKAEAKRLEEEAAEAKAEAKRARAEAEAAQAAAADAKAQVKAAKAANAEAKRLEEEAAEAKAEAKRARAEAETAQASAADAKAQAKAAKAEAAAQKKDAEAAKAEAATQKKDAEAMRAEAERMLGEAKERLVDASAEAKAAKKSQEAAVAAQAKAEKKEESARAAEAKAADERKAAQKALDAAEKARAAGDDDAEKRIADAEARLKKAEKARTTAEEQRKAAETSAEDARALAERRKVETDDAVAAKSKAEKDKKAAAAAADEAEERAARAEALRKEEDTAAAAAAEAKAAGRREEAKKLEKEAAQAKKAREKEEAQLAAIVAERGAVEAELADAKKAAETARKDADAAEKRAARAIAEAEEAEARAAGAAKAEKTAKAEAAKAEKVAKAEKAKAAPAPAPVKKKKAAAVAVEDVSFEQDGDDAKVIIEMSGEVEPEVKASGKRVEMTLAGVEMPKKLERTLDVTKFDGAIESVSSYRDGDKVRVVVEMNSAITPKVERSGTTVRMRFVGAGGAVAKKPAKKSKAKVKTESIPAPVVGGYGASSAPVTSKSVAQSSGSRRKVYRGPTIDLDFKDADIHNLLRFLANIGRVSIVVPDDIKATVTVRLKRVPWDQALEVILASKGLWYRKEGNLYRVAPRKVLDAEDQAEAERIRAAVQSEVPEAEVFTLNYANAEETQEKLLPLLSPKGKIEVDSRTNSLIINDIRAHRRRIIDLAARLDTQTPQIMIEARIVEARSTYARDIGIQWGGSANASQAGGNATGLIFPNSIGITGGAEDRLTPTGGVAAPSDFAVNLPATVGTGIGGALGISLGSVGGNFNLNLRLSAAEDTGSVRIISSPKIMVLNNVEAEISQGQSIPISVVSAQGTQTQFVPAELSLKVTPYVSQRDCSIAMNVEVTKNEPDFVNTGARGDPTILTKEAKTRLLVADGETTVLGGITTRNTGIAYSKVPFFGDLPVIGWFFKRRQESDDRTELLIFITPKITNKAFLRCE